MYSPYAYGAPVPWSADWWPAPTMTPVQAMPFNAPIISLPAPVSLPASSMPVWNNGWWDAAPSFSAPVMLDTVPDRSGFQIAQLAGGGAAAEHVPAPGFYGSEYTVSPSEKTYYSDEFRNQRKFKQNTEGAYTGDIPRHRLAPGVVAGAAAYAPGPRLSQEKIDALKDLLTGRDNVERHGTQRANQADERAEQAVLQHAQSGDFGAVPLPPHQKAHMDHAFDWVVKHQDELKQQSPGTFKQLLHMTGATQRADEPSSHTHASGVNPADRPLASDPVQGYSASRGPLFISKHDKVYTVTPSGYHNYTPVHDANIPRSAHHHGGAGHKSHR